jgi:hypothetical protein
MTATHPATQPHVVCYASGAKEWLRYGVLHREDGPASTIEDGSCEWWLDGKRHRIGGPASTYSDGTTEWWVDGKLHREDGPAIVTNHLRGKEEYWYQNGKMHRDNGPASMRMTSNKWYKNGLLHREDGPAIEYPDCSIDEYYINGHPLSSAEFAMLDKEIIMLWKMSGYCRPFDFGNR